MYAQQDNNKTFSKFFSNIKFVADTSSIPDCSIVDVWFDPETGNYFGNYYTSGIRAITGRLATKLLEQVRR